MSLVATLPRTRTVCLLSHVANVRIRLRSSTMCFSEIQIHQTHLRHQALDAYINWLQKTADVDIKLLFKRLKWRSTLLHKYVHTRDALQAEVNVLP